MTKLDELKRHIEDNITYLKTETESILELESIEIPILSAKTLIQIAEAAFEMPEPLDGLHDCGFCGGCPHFGEMQHKNDCVYQRIQDLKKELEQ